MRVRHTSLHAAETDLQELFTNREQQLMDTLIACFPEISENFEKMKERQRLQVIGSISGDASSWAVDSEDMPQLDCESEGMCVDWATHSLPPALGFGNTEQDELDEEEFGSSNNTSQLAIEAEYDEDDDGETGP